MASRRHTGSVPRAPQGGGFLARLAYAHAAAAGVRLGPILKHTGLTRRQIHDRTAPVKVRDQIEFLNLVAEALDDDLLGFHLACHYDLREIGWYYYVITSSENLLEAFQRSARCSALVNESVAQQCIDGREIGLRFGYAGIRRHQDRHQIEFWATSLVRMSREMTGLRLVPSRVHLIHRRGSNATKMARFFGSDIKFGAAVDEVIFSRRFRDQPLLKGDPYLNRLLVGYCERAIAERRRHPHLMVTRVENAIVPLLPHGDARATHVARRLGVSQRSLARHLAREGLSFTGVLNRLRLELATQYLGDERLAVSEVAWLLGYQDVAAFSNAFKRWTGKAPTINRDSTRVFTRKGK